jgi:hypothetical protein
MLLFGGEVCPDRHEASEALGYNPGCPCGVKSGYDVGEVGPKDFELGEGAYEGVIG